MVVRALAAAALLAVAGAAQSQWMWRDKNGTHASDMPPPASVPEKDILRRPGAGTPRAAAPAAPPPAPSAASAAPADKPRIDPELEARMRKAEQEKQAQKKREEEQQQIARTENCARAKEQLRTMESGIRVARVNERGEREIMDDRTRAEQAQRARAAIQSDCR